MSGKRITELGAGTVKLTDLYPAVDITDTSMAPSGTDKKYTISDLSDFVNTNVLEGLIKTQTISMSFAGCIAPRNENVTFYRIGNLVMMKFPTFSALITTPGSSISSITAIPADYMPAGAGSFNLVYGGFSAIDDGATGVDPAPGQISLYPGGFFSVQIDVYNPTLEKFAGFSKTYAGVKGGSIIYMGA